MILLMGSSAFAQAPARYGVRVGSDLALIRPGVEVSGGTCPCYRTVIAAQLVSGLFEVQEFIFTSAGLVQFEEATVPVFQSAVRRTYRVGEFDLTHRPSGVGLRFEGVTWGTDLDRGLTDMIGSGVRLQYRLMATSEFYAELGTGYRYDGFSADRRYDRHSIPTEIALYWADPHFRGNIRLAVTPDQIGDFAPSRARLHASADVSARLLPPAPVDFVGIGIGAAGRVEYDPVLPLFGLDPLSYTGFIYLEGTFLAARSWTTTTSQEEP